MVQGNVPAESGSVSLSKQLFDRDAWLSDVLQVASFRVRSLPAGMVSAELGSAMASQMPGGPTFLFAKLASSNVADVEKFVRAGFNVTDVSVTFEHAGGHPGVVSQQVEVASAADADEVADLAGRCFTFSRFHADPRIGPARANAVKREWARNSCLGRAAVVYIVRRADKILGFLAVLNRKTPAGAEAVIDLIGVDAAHQGNGYGRLLTQHFIADWNSRSERLRVGTQASNIPALRLYESLGFRVSETAYVLHAHTRNGEVVA